MIIIISDFLIFGIKSKSRIFVLMVSKSEPDKIHSIILRVLIFFNELQQLALGGIYLIFVNKIVFRFTSSYLYQLLEIHSARNMIAQKLNQFFGRTCLFFFCGHLLTINSSLRYCVTTVYRK